MNSPGAAASVPALTASSPAFAMAAAASFAPACTVVAAAASAPTFAVAAATASGWRRSTTLVSPATICTPASRAVAAMLCTTCSNTSRFRPSSRIKAAVRYKGRAPIQAKSFTVPHTAKRPISPPGKKSGVTTKLSVVSTGLPASSGSTAPSSMRLKISF